MDGRERLEETEKKSKWRKQGVWEREREGERGGWERQTGDVQLRSRTYSHLKIGRAHV